MNHGHEDAKPRADVRRNESCDDIVCDAEEKLVRPESIESHLAPTFAANAAAACSGVASMYAIVFLPLTWPKWV